MTVTCAAACGPACSSPACCRSASFCSIGADAVSTAEFNDSKSAVKSKPAVFPSFFLNWGYSSRAIVNGGERVRGDRVRYSGTVIVNGGEREGDRVGYSSTALVNGGDRKSVV